ncbi:MAG: trypsin-like peptidase domain-containing protein [Planctomycetota bacterium]
MARRIQPEPDPPNGWAAILRRRAGLASIGVLVCLGPASGWVLGQEPSALGVATAMEQVVVDAIARAERSVVAIARVEKPRAGETLNLEFRPDPFGERTTLFGSPRPTDPDFIPNEYGTGVVVDRQGLILTAYHVLGEDSDYYVTTHDRKVFLATVKGADPRSDLAVLAVQATDLEPISLGDAPTLRKGQFVIALGNPYAIARDGQVSASWGIVANLARKAPLVSDEAHPTGKSTLHHFGTLIQTDAKLNLGTSGGPLLNLKGEMVGLTTALAATAGYERSAGYAFPVDETFRRVVEALKLGREVEYGFLGIAPVNLRPEAVLSGLQGTLIERVVPGMPGQRFGLQSGDIVTTVNGKAIHDADELVLEVGRLPVESVVRLGVLRDDQRLELDIALTKLKVRGKKVVTAPAPAWRGMRVDYPSALLDPFAGGGLAGPAFDEGVVVADVEEATRAWEAGLRPGMLVSHVDRVAVGNPKEFQEAVSGKTGSVELRLAELDGQAPPQVVVRGS